MVKYRTTRPIRLGGGIQIRKGHVVNVEDPDKHGLRWITEQGTGLELQCAVPDAKWPTFQARTLEPLEASDDDP